MLINACQCLLGLALLRKILKFDYRDSWGYVKCSKDSETGLRIVLKSFYSIFTLVSTTVSGCSLFITDSCSLIFDVSGTPISILKWQKCSKSFRENDFLNAHLQCGKTGKPRNQAFEVFRENNLLCSSRKWDDFTKFFKFFNFSATKNAHYHSVEKWKIYSHQKKFRQINFLVTFKTVAFTKFLPQMCESEFPL